MVPKLQFWAFNVQNYAGCGIKNGCYVLPGKDVYRSSVDRPDPHAFSGAKPPNGYEIAVSSVQSSKLCSCLLYTSDAADE